MSNKRLTPSGRALLRLWMAAMLLAVLSGCGGGGGAGGDPGPAPRVLSGQVVKGLTQGASVYIYRLDDNGARTLLGSAMSDAQGSFRITQELVADAVYLLEAVGGEYVNEITGLTETLTTPLRGVFVASDNENGFALSALSEAVVSDVEQTVGTAKWSASAVAQANVRALNAFGIAKPLSRRFVDLTNLVPGSDTSLTEDDIGFSLQAGVFAGFWHELRLRSPGVTLAQALQNFRAASYGETPDNALTAALSAGLVRFVERVPALETSRSTIYAAAGLPTYANSAAFDGAVATGQSSVRVPDGQLRLVEDQPAGYVGAPGSETYFDSRGALLGSRVGPLSAGSGFRFIGTASAAEVYGNADLAIGRWNRGYHFPGGVLRDAVTGQFDATTVAQQTSTSDFVYAAGKPATNLPQCGSVFMSPRAQTLAFQLGGSTRTLTVDASSGLSYHRANGQTRVGYTLVLRDNLGATYTLASDAGSRAPWKGAFVDDFQRFESISPVTVTDGSSFGLKGLLVGDGATKAVVKIVGTGFTSDTGMQAVVFERDGTTRDCAPQSYATGTVSPTPGTGDYYAGNDGLINLQSGLQFLTNGTPLLPLLSGITDATGVEKSGNDQAGIGLLLPPFASAYGGSYLSPQQYLYVKASIGPVIAPNQTGTMTYRLVASTSNLIKFGDQLISVAPPIASATLTIDLDRHSTLGTFSDTIGTCHLTIAGQLRQPDPGTFYKPNGTCILSSSEAFTGAITGGLHQYAALMYRDYALGSDSGVALLFERNP